MVFVLCLVDEDVTRWLATDGEGATLLVRDIECMCAVFSFLIIDQSGTPIKDEVRLTDASDADV